LFPLVTAQYEAPAGNGAASALAQLYSQPTSVAAVSSAVLAAGSAGTSPTAFVALNDATLINNGVVYNGPNVPTAMAAPNTTAAPVGGSISLDTVLVPLQITGPASSSLASFKSLHQPAFAAGLTQFLQNSSIPNSFAFRYAIAFLLPLFSNCPPAVT
jgi:hypothetical protein